MSQKDWQYHVKQLDAYGNGWAQTLCFPLVYMRTRLDVLPQAESNDSQDENDEPSTDGRYFASTVAPLEKLYDLMASCLSYIEDHPLFKVFMSIVGIILCSVGMAIHLITYIFSVGFYPTNLGFLSFNDMWLTFYPEKSNEMKKNLVISLRSWLGLLFESLCHLLIDTTRHSLYLCCLVIEIGVTLATHLAFSLTALAARLSVNKTFTGIVGVVLLALAALSYLTPVLNLSHYAFKMVVMGACASFWFAAPNLWSSTTKESDQRYDNMAAFAKDGTRSGFAVAMMFTAMYFGGGVVPLFLAAVTFILVDIVVSSNSEANPASDQHDAKKSEVNGSKLYDRVSPQSQGSRQSNPLIESPLASMHDLVLSPREKPSDDQGEETGKTSGCSMS